jgi:hypothetical protein
MRRTATHIGNDRTSFNADGPLRNPPWLGEAEKLMEARDFFGKIVLVPD